MKAKNILFWWEYSNILGHRKKGLCFWDKFSKKHVYMYSLDIVKRCVDKEFLENYIEKCMLYSLMSIRIKMCRKILTGFVVWWKTCDSLTNIM